MSTNRQSGKNELAGVGKLGFAISDREKVRLQLTEFKGKQYVDFRRFYQKEGDYAPGKGLSIPVAALNKRRCLKIAAIFKALAEHVDE